MLRIFDTLTARKREFVKRGAEGYRIFVCGPTVQDNIHLGHAKTYLAFDVLVRWLLKKGNRIFFLVNVTDIDDKIFDRAKKENTSYLRIAGKFYDEFVEDLESLNIITVSKFGRVSDYTESSALLVKRLLDSGKAYRLNGNIYFDTSKADRFGKLSHQTPFELRLKQIDAAPGKKNSVDFLLWRKISDASEGVWNHYSVGEGRPGWHIQDSAIAFDEIGGPYDLHGGATELIFPHHESELAQDEALSGQIPFVSTWMHTGLLLKDGEKMSKSLGNVVTVRDALMKYGSDAIRYYFLRRHYRDSLEMDLQGIRDSRQQFEKVRQAARRAPKSSVPSKHELRIDVQRNTSGESGETEASNEFSRAMDDDLDTPTAIRLLNQSSDELIKAGTPSADLVAQFWDMVEILGFRLFD